MEKETRWTEGRLVGLKTLAWERSKVKSRLVTANESQIEEGTESA